MEDMSQETFLKSLMTLVQIKTGSTIGYRVKVPLIHSISGDFKAT